MNQIDLNNTISRSFERLKEQWQVLLPVALIWYLVAGVAVTLVFWMIVGSSAGVGSLAGGGFAALGAALLSMLIAIPISVLISIGMSMVTAGALFHGIDEFESGHAPSVGDTLTAGGRIGPLVSTGVTVGVIAMAASLMVIIPVLGFIALVVLAIWFGVRWMFAAAVVIDEGLTGRDALRRSREIVDSSGQFWVILATVVVLGIIGAVVAALLGFVIGIVLDHGTVGGLLMRIVSFALNGFTAVLVALGAYDIYTQLTRASGSAEPGTEPFAGDTHLPPV